MPTYEYECKRCGYVFDHFQSIKARPLRSHHCSRCGRSRPVARRLGTGGALLFRGNGFYHTDYRSESYRKAASAESTRGDTAAKSADSKPAAKETSAKSSGTGSNTSKSTSGGTGDSKSKASPAD
ncbi:MAG: zinc ribbon domain-containing protein [Phycisphaerae bacterium]|nr:zinc ribbon domain-containing protein [Phycisphaerae bacterium]